MATSNNVNDIFELEPVYPTPKELVPLIGNTEYETAKHNMEGIIEIGAQSLNELSKIAMASQDPRIYRVFTELFSAMVTANKDLVTIKQIKVDTDNKEIVKKNDTTIHNNLFVGSTAELAEILDKKNKE